jgi:1,2-diacylglycerol 3-alpha-glucosyltransferase
MRVGLFSDTYPPQINGVANSTYILRCELEKHGHEVYVVTTYAGSGMHKWDEKDPHVLRLAGLTLKSLYGYVATSPFHIAATEEVGKLHLDVIHAQTEFGVGIFARLCARSLQIPLVSTYHTTYEDYTHYVNFINSRTVEKYAKIGVAKVAKLYGDTSMEVIAPSNKTRDMLEGYHIRREINVIPTGLQLDQFSPAHVNAEKTKAIREECGFGESDKVIIYVGRLASEKSLDLVIRGAAKAAEKNPAICMMIVGGGPDSNNLKQLAKDLHADKNIVLTGPKPSEEIADYYRCADAFISASLSETQGMTFIEAMAAGLPLFARKDEVLDDLLIPEKTGWFFKDENDLSELLIKFAGISAEKEKQMSSDCVLQVKPYNSEIFYENVLQVYQRVIDDYRDLYTIDDVHIKDGTVQLYLISSSKDELRLQVSVDDYYNMGLRKGGVMTKHSLSEMQYREVGTLAYQKCIHRLSVKDRSRKEIYDWLTQNTECDIRTVNEIVERLEDKGYINDERYCEEEITRMKASLAGHNKIVRILTKHGLPAELVEEKLSAQKNDEDENARRYAEKVIHSHHGDSVNGTKTALKQKLILQGYSVGTADRIAAESDFSKCEIHEIDNLRKCCYKARRRYERKYSGSELRNRLFRYCAAKGYTMEDIYTVLDEMEWNDD